MGEERLLTKKLALSGVFAAVIFILTAFVRIPLATGYIHLGDAAIFAACVYLGRNAALSAAAGSALADLIGYPQYAPFTFIIKGAMALTAVLIIQFGGKKRPRAARDTRDRTGNTDGTGATGAMSAADGTDMTGAIDTADTIRAEPHGMTVNPAGGKPRGLSPYRAAFAFTAASVFMNAAYTLTDRVLAGVGGGVYVFLTVEFLKGFIQSAVCIPLALLALRVLKNARIIPK
jgi:hypothetical protein